MSDWIRTVDASAHGRLLCLPYAGGGTADYRGWRDALPGTVDLCPVVLPGRETRLGEAPFTDLHTLVRALADSIAPLLRRAPFAIYGHSMGAWLGFELTRELRRRRLPLPRHLIVGARRAPHVADPLPPLSGLPDDAFLAGMQERYGAIPDAIRASPDLLALFLPALRADITLLDGYVFEQEPPLDVPITGLHGRGDPHVAAADVRSWSQHTTARFDMRALFGDHFFVRDPGGEAADIVGGILASQLR